MTAFVATFETFYIRQIRGEHNTTYHASTFTGDDTDDGTTWALARLTLGGINGLNPAAGDSVLLHGTFTEDWAPDDDGTSGSKIMVYDSLSGTLGVNFTNPDSSKLWSAIISGSGTALTLSGEDYWTFTGIRMTGMTALGVSFASGTGNLLYQMKFDTHGDGGGAFVQYSVGGAVADSTISCVFIEPSGINNAIVVANAGTPGPVIINNSAYGVYTSIVLDVNDTDGPIVVINNALDQTSTVAADRVIHMDDATPTTNMEFNYNMFNKGEDNNFRFNTAVFNLIATWEDSTNNYLSGNSDNSVDDDPEFSSTAVTGTLFITTDSPAFDAGVARGGFQDASNPSIGWYQPVAAGDTPTPATPPKGKFFIFSSLGVKGEHLCQTE